jgi:hypothetical protein
MTKGVSVIKINSFSPVDNFARRTWEFHTNHMVIKIRSLTLEYEYEVEYEKIKAIWSGRVMDLAWLWAVFITTGTLGLVNLGLNHFDITSPIIDVIEKIVGLLALTSLVLAFLRYDYYSFLDVDENSLATIRVDKTSKRAVLEAIKLIKQKAEITSETYFDDSLPSTPPAFQYTDFDFADFLNKLKVSVYDDRIIVVQKSLVEEFMTVIKFDDLSGKTKLVRMVNERWDYVWSYWLFFLCITVFSAEVFFSEQLKGNSLFPSLSGGGLALLIPLFALRFVKNDVLVFYDKKDNGIFGTRINLANREKLNQIVGFVQSKVALKQ